jgi:hypothetical protein
LSVEFTVAKAAVTVIPDPDDNPPPVVGSGIRNRKRQDCVNRANAAHLLRKRRAIDLVHGKF